MNVCLIGNHVSHRLFGTGKAETVVAAGAETVVAAGADAGDSEVMAFPASW